ncbi:hypothetical protein FBZ82_12617 [Azospirillum brasilense]|uniref:DNA-binding protein n=1 Tax=Azospirillum brasilense TaxID=192 RepID=A0A560AG03_AZOBR|nr:DNA-binding protein [Azospirillum brasilense]TWA59256.1 hypothetical protein FBZ82_12617 [Azospirillum brasilense]
MDPIAVDIREACRVSGLTRTRIFGEIRNGALEAKRAGKRTLVLYASLKALVQSLPPAGSKSGRGAA